MIAWGLGVVRRAVTGGLAVTALFFCGGKLLGWHWFRTYRAIDLALFASGAGLFCLGSFQGGPPSMPRPEDATPPGAGDPGSAARPGETDGPETAAPEAPPPDPASIESETLARARRRAPALMIAGLGLLATSYLVARFRVPLGRLYGWRPGTAAEKLSRSPTAEP